MLLVKLRKDYLVHLLVSSSLRVTKSLALSIEMKVSSASASLFFPLFGEALDSHTTIVRRADVSVGMQRVKHSFGGDANENRQRSKKKQAKKTRTLECADFHSGGATWPCHLTTRHWRSSPCGCLERSDVDSACSFSGEAWLEQLFRATETFGANSDDVPVWELAGLLLVSRFELCVVIHTNVAQFLDDIPSNLPVDRH